MRFLAVFLLIGALFGAGCDAPARDPGVVAARESTRPLVAPDPATDAGNDVLTLHSVPIPAGFPGEGRPPQVAFTLKLRDAWVVGDGTVDRILRDDTKRPRHQRFVVRVGTDQTVMIAHNIDLAPRVPLKRGDRIAFRGKYVWNEQGGIVHWTHRDRRDRNAGGWIVWKGQNFR
jgi:hypothetical protein